jgi:hypothetical protein
MKITKYTIDRYDEVLVLMQKTPGASIRDADSQEINCPLSSGIEIC